MCQKAEVYQIISVVNLHKLYVKVEKIGPLSFFFFVLNLCCDLAVEMEISAVKIWTLEL